MTRSLNIPVTNDTVWKIVTEIASNSHTLKAHIKNQMMAGREETEKEVKAEVRNLQKTKQQYTQERTDLETAIVKIQTDRVMKRISEKQTKDILANINTELKGVTARLADVDIKLKDTGNQQRWIDWVGHFHNTYSNVEKFDEEQQKQYLSGLVDKIDVNLDAETNEHVLDIKFQYPMVDDEYVILSGAEAGKKREYETRDGNFNTSVKGEFNFKSSGANTKKNKERRE